MYINICLMFGELYLLDCVSGFLLAVCKISYLYKDLYIHNLNKDTNIYITAFFIANKTKRINRSFVLNSLFRTAKSFREVFISLHSFLRMRHAGSKPWQ